MVSEVGGRKRLAAWALAILLLAIGAVGGMAVDRLLQGDARRGPRRGPPSPEELVERMQRDLDLTTAQARAIGDVLDARQRALSTLFARVDPEAEAIRKEASSRIRAVLDPAQQARFDAQMVEVERRRAELRERFQTTRSEPIK
ncbi:MAG TPA: hypothetical protein VFK85_01815 [Anaeromyxobacteraceae bacterium]|nr:hypothetical protein [Anaeromyxobacteraceae bacterium]